MERFCEILNLEKPPRPKPIYSFFPIYSPVKVDDNDGFYLGEDNCINSIYIKDGSLFFELSAVLRPGRFLGNHYIAFTVPARTFIVTLDRVKEGMRAARKAKKAGKARQETVRAREGSRRLRRQTAQTTLEHAIDAELSLTNDRTKGTSAELNTGKKERPKNFFSRFVDGYLREAERRLSEKEMMTNSIRDFFGRQVRNATSIES